MYTNEFASQNRLSNLKSIIGRIEGENCVISSGPPFLWTINNFKKHETNCEYYGRNKGKHSATHGNL